MVEMNKADRYLISDIFNILNNGFKDENPRPKYEDGSLAHTLSVNHVVRKYDLSKEFPISSLRNIAWKNAIKEILWIYQMKSNSLDTLENVYNIHWWNAWESKDFPGTIGNRYGHTIEKYDIFNKRVLEEIKNDPYGRRHICNLWQEDELNSSDGLYPCAYETIWNVRGEYLDMMLIQRSGDMLVASGAGGVNECQYAALLLMTAHVLKYKPGIFTHIISNEQIYDRHIENAKELISRSHEIKNGNIEYSIPKMILNSMLTDFNQFSIDDFTLIDYNPCTPQLKFDLGV